MANRAWVLPSFQLEKQVVRLYAQIKFGAAEVDQITFAALASTGDGDYFVVTDWTGKQWAVALDTTGGAANTPTGAAWTAIPSGQKVYTNVSSATTGSDVSTLVHTAINALTGFTTNVSAATSTTHQNLTNLGAGVCTAPAVYSKAGAAGTGSITKSVTTAGTNNTLVTANSKGIASLTQNAAGKYTLVFGTNTASLDYYYKLLSVKVAWDATANSGTAPAAPLVYLTGNSVATAATCSLQLCTNNTSQTATNPAATEQCFVEICLSNSGAA